MKPHYTNTNNPIDFPKLDKSINGINARLDDLMYDAGLTAQGCWDEMDEYDRVAIKKLAELIVKETMQVVSNNLPQDVYLDVSYAVTEHFGTPK